MESVTIEEKIFEKIIESSSIEKKIRLLGLQICNDYENKRPLFIGVLNGSFIFLADLLRQITIPCEVSFVKFSSYKGELNHLGKLDELIGLYQNIEDRHVIIVDDIIDSGQTISNLINNIKEKKPKSVSIATFVSKDNPLKCAIDEFTYVGFEIPNDFVIGYGLDFMEQGRNLPHLYKLID